MIVKYFLFFVLILLSQRSLFSQVTCLNNSTALSIGRYSQLRVSSASKPGFSIGSHPISVASLDTLHVKPLEIGRMEDQIVQQQWIRGAIIPASLMLAGTITLLPESHCLLSKYTIHDKIIHLFPGVNSPIDNYLQFAPLAVVFGLKATGVKSRSDFLNQAIITAKSELLMNAVVRAMKTWIPVERPSGGKNSMPSGHTAQAFLSATILDMEYRDTSPWISVGGYAVATTTAMYRMINNQHWISDVLIGAGIGIFSTKVVYYTHRYRWSKKNNVVILPAIYKNGGGVSFTMVL